MRKIFAFVLTISMLLSMASCMDSLNLRQTNMTSSNSSTTLNPNTNDAGTSDWPSISVRTLEMYNTVLSDEEIPEYFIHYNQLKEWGMFSRFTTSSCELYSLFETYTYSLGGVDLYVDHRGNTFYEYFTYKDDFIVLVSHPEDDFRTCSYTVGDAVYVENGIAYYYLKGKLTSIHWMYNGIMFRIERPYNGPSQTGEFIIPTFENWTPWRNWPSLFMNRVSANRAIEFFDLMFKGELPTLEEVFGPVRDEYGNLNITPCEITWQKPAAPAQTA